jgi:hypothetical protein
MQNKIFCALIFFLSISSIQSQTDEGYFEYYQLKNRLFRESDHHDNDSIFNKMIAFEIPLNEVNSLIKKVKKAQFDNKKIYLSSLKAKKLKRKTKNYNTEYQSKLKELYVKDQKYRKNYRNVEKWSIEVDSLNSIQIQMLINKYGLPTYSNVNDETINMFGVLLNHQVFDSSLVDIEKVNTYFKQGCISPMFTTLLIDKYSVLVKKQSSYFNIFSPKFNLSNEEQIIFDERRKKYGIDQLKIFGV